MTQYDGIYPDTLLDEHPWFTWKYTSDEDPRKVPRAPWNNTDYHDKYVSAQDPDVWVDADTAFKWADALPGHKPATVIRDREEYPEENKVLFDFDDVRDPETGNLHDEAIALLRELNTYSQVSTSGTGVHAIGSGELPDHVKSVKGELAASDEFPDAEIEVYDNARFIAMTGDHVPGTPTDICDVQETLDEIAQEYVTTPAAMPEGMEEEPDLSRTEVAAIETTSDMDEIFDAIKLTEPSDIRLRSPVTSERGDGTKSRDPLWADSASGTRLAELQEGWVYRKGMIGLDALQVVALEERIITEETDYPSGGDFWDAVEALRSRGAHIPEFEPADDIDDAQLQEYAHTLDRRRSFDTIDDIELPQAHSYVLDKPPRAGGSYAILQDFTAADMPFMVLAPRHSILDYHVETVSELVDEDTSIVHLKGKVRVCESGGGECELIPRDRDAYQEAMAEIRNIVHRSHLIQPGDAPHGICKHWFLSKAAEFADVILTVPQIARRVDVDRSGMRLFIDEEQTLDYFHPGAMELVTVGAVTESDGSTTVQLRGAPILTELDTLHEIVETINAEQAERAEDGKTDQYHEQPHEADIKAAVRTLEAIADALGITAAKREVLDRGDEPTLKATVQELKQRLDAIEFPEPSTDPDQLVQQLSEYARPYFWSDEVDPEAALTAVLFQYEEHPFHWKQTGGEFTVRLIGDKRQIFHPDFFGEFEQVALIAGPGGERFIDEVREDPVAVELESFPYADEFAVIPLGKRRDGDMEPVDSQRGRVERVTRLLNQRPHPHMAVTGTKDRAEQLDNSLVKTTSNVVAEPDDPAMELYKMWTAAESAIIYENSIVSRGIDAPYFDVTTIIAPGFATPYWEARAEHYRGKDGEAAKDAYLEAVAVQQELKDRELTNAALRMSHTYDTADKLGTKFIVTAHDDAERLKYLQDRVTPKMTYADQVADLVSLLTAQGAFQAELESVSEALGGGHKDFTNVALDEEFSETHIERPSYTFDEIEEWVDSAYMNDEKVKAVITSVQRLTDPSTSDIIDDVNITSHGRTRAILNVLERKGWVFSTTGESEGGRPPTVWKVSERVQ